MIKKKPQSRKSTSTGVQLRVIPSLQSLDKPNLKAGREKKRLFIGLVSGTCGLMILLLALAWMIPIIGLANIHSRAPLVFTCFIGLVMTGIMLAASGLIYNVKTGTTLPFFKRIRGLTIKLFLPLMILLGRFAGISKDRIRSSFIKVNNELVSSSKKVYLPGQMLLLVPHCLQNSKCTRRLTYNINNCKRCGKCTIDDLLALSSRYGIHLAIATGSTIARRIVVKRRPKVILAVACERDLASGIQNTYPIPVYGVLNFQPNGPCFDTEVSMKDLEQAIHRFMDPLSFPKNNEESGEDRDTIQITTANHGKRDKIRTMAMK